MKNLLLLLALITSVETFGQGKVLARYYLQKKKIDNHAYTVYLGNPSYPGTATQMRFGTAPGTKKLLKCDINFSNGVNTIDIWGYANFDLDSNQVTVDSTDHAYITYHRCGKKVRSSSWDKEGTVYHIYADPNYAAEKTHPEIIGAHNNIANDKFFFNFQRTTLVPYPSQSKVLFAGLNYGVITIPLKIRPAAQLDSASKSAGSKQMRHLPINAVASFNLGLFFGGSIGQGHISFKGIRTFAFTGGLFVGPSAVTLQAPTTGTLGTVNNPQDFKQTLNNNNSSVTLPALSYGFSFIGSINTFGLVMALGWDSPFGETRSYWVYKEKFWAGLGFVANLPL